MPLPSSKRLTLLCNNIHITNPVVKDYFKILVNLKTILNFGIDVFHMLPVAHRHWHWGANIWHCLAARVLTAEKFLMCVDNLFQKIEPNS
jgi:hypothetical protein